MAVVAYMKAHGLRPDVDLVAVAFGANRPEAPNNTTFGRAKNRRVAFVVIGNSVQNENPAREIGESGLN